MDVFKSAMQRKSVKDSDLYDWEKETSEEDSVNILQATLAAAALNNNNNNNNNKNNNNNNNTNVLNQSQKNTNITNGGGSLVTPYGENHNHHLQPQSLNNNNSNMNNLNQVKDQELNNNIESSLKNENMITNDEKLVNNSNTADLHASPRRMNKGLERISSKRNATPNNPITNTNSANAMAVTPVATSGIGTSGAQPTTAVDRDTLSNQSQQRRSRYIEQDQKCANNKATYLNQQTTGQTSKINLCLRDFFGSLLIFSISKTILNFLNN